MNRERLTKLLIDKIDTAILKIFNAWMTGHTDNLKSEAIRINDFMIAWRESRSNQYRSSRHIQNDAITIGLTKEIEKHIIRALKQENANTEETYKVLKWISYGSEKGSKEDKRSKIFNCVLNYDFYELIKAGKPLSSNKVAKISGYSRKTINKYRTDNDYIQSLQIQEKAFNFIKDRHDKKYM